MSYRSKSASSYKCLARTRRRPHPARAARLRNMLGLGIVFKALLLLVNAMAVLHEERFLKKGEGCRFSRREPAICAPCARTAR